MTQIEIILVLTITLAMTWCSIAFYVAVRTIRSCNRKIEYYQHPQTQIKIAEHVIQQKWYRTGGEVFK